MRISYDQIFDNADQLADFLMLPNSEQISELAQCVTTLKNVKTVCELPKENNDE